MESTFDIPDDLHTPASAYPRLSEIGLDSELTGRGESLMGSFVSQQVYDGEARLAGART